MHNTAMGKPCSNLTIPPARTVAVRCAIMVAALVTTSSTACSDNDTNTTNITTTNPSMTMPTVPSEPTDVGATVDTDSTDITGAASETDATVTATTDDGGSSTSTGDAGTTGETTDEPHSCWPDEPEACSVDGDCDALLECDGDVCGCATIAEKGADFCSVVRVLAMEAGVIEPYLGFVDDMCMSGEDRCVVCFNLQNYCDQLAGQCAGLYAACGCVGEFYGVN